LIPQPALNEKLLAQTPRLRAFLRSSTSQLDQQAVSSDVAIYFGDLSASILMRLFVVFPALTRYLLVVIVQFFIVSHVITMLIRLSDHGFRTAIVPLPRLSSSLCRTILRQLL
jgi:hypothetical protein